MVVALLDAQPGERVLDACAAPGGKTLFTAARMQGQVSRPRTTIKHINSPLAWKSYSCVRTALGLFFVGMP